MTRKDYIVLAAALRRTIGAAQAAGRPYNDGASDQWRFDVRSIADALQADNGHFDRARFYEAAGYEVDTSAFAFETI